MYTSPAPSQIGPYAVLRKIGEGAMGSVYLARHEVLRVEHAIKVLSADLAHDPTARERFLREARHSARLNHPNIVRVFNADTHQDLPYLVMEFVKGRTVSSLLSAGPLSTHRAVRYAYQVAQALGAAHGHGVIHRDVKPDNVMITDDDMAKLMDFGLVLAKNNAEVGLTAVGISMGTPYFMSPEQWFDEGVDERADLYALGVTLYHMLSRRYPFEGQEPLEVAQRMMKHELLHLQVASPDIDPSLATLVHRAMARTPGQRFQTASEMADALSRWWSQHPPLVPNLTLDQPMPTAASSMVTRQPSRTRVQALGAEPRTGVYAAPLSGVTSHDFSAPRAPMGVALKRPQSGLQEVPMGPRLQQMQPQAAGAMRELAPNTYWVGKRTSPGAPPCNTYLRAFRAPSSGAQAFALINPCAGEDVEGLGAKLEPVMGGLDKLSLLFVGHPDPLVALTAAQLCAHLNDQAPLLASTQTWQQVGELGIRRGRFVAAEDYGRGMRLPTGHSLLPVAAAFCASAGAVMLYDPDTRVLFSGDLMSSLSPRDTLGPWADESDWSGVRAFHQRVMPCTQALRRVVAAVRKLSPAVSVVAPHRGRVVRGELVGLFLDRLEALTVGIESLDARLDDAAHLSDWDAVLQRVVSAAARALGSDALDALSADYILRDDLQPDPTSTSGWRVVRLGAATVARCLRLLTAAASPEVARQLRAEAERACKAQGLPPLPT